MNLKTAALAPWTVPGALLLLGTALTGCAGAADFQDNIFQAAPSGDFTLPRGEGSGTPIPLWDAVIILCPYDDTKALPEPYATAAEGLNTASTEAVQWLLFSKDGGAKRISLNRSAVDFCHNSNPAVEYQHTQAWAAEKSDGAWLMTSIGPHATE